MCNNELTGWQPEGPSYPQGPPPKGGSSVARPVARNEPCPCVGCAKTKPKPTIEELETILKSDDRRPVEIWPDGTVHPVARNELQTCSGCIQREYCLAHEQCHYTKSWMRNPDGTPRDATGTVYDPTGPYPPGYGNTGFSSPPPAPDAGYGDIAACIRRAARLHRGKWLQVDITDAISDISAELYRLGNIGSVTEASYLSRVRKVVGVTNYISDTGTGSVVWSWSV